MYYGNILHYCLPHVIAVILIFACKICTNHNCFFNYAVCLNKHTEVTIGILISHLAEATSFEDPVLLTFDQFHLMILAAGHKFQDQGIQSAHSSE
jgi:hypothetical protein